MGWRRSGLCSPHRPLALAQGRLAQVRRSPPREVILATSFRPLFAAMCMSTTRCALAQPRLRVACRHGQRRRQARRALYSPSAKVIWRAVRSTSCPCAPLFALARAKLPSLRRCAVVVAHRARLRSRLPAWRLARPHLRAIRSAAASRPWLRDTGCCFGGRPMRLVCAVSCDTIGRCTPRTAMSRQWWLRVPRRRTQLLCS